MSRRIAVVIEADDRATGKVRMLGTELGLAATKGGGQAAAAMQRASVSISNSIETMASKAKAFSTIIAGVGVGLAARAGLRFGVEFQHQMSAVQAVTGVTKAQLADLAKVAENLGPTFGFTAIEAGKAMENLGLAGFTTNEILELLPSTLVLARAGAVDLAEATTIASDVLRGMVLPTSDLARVVDVLAYAAVNTNAEVQDLGISFRYTASVAKAFGVPLEEVTAALGVLANRGIRAEMAGTGLRRIISVMNGDLEEGEKGLSGYGIKLTDVNGNFIGLTKTVDLLVKSQVRFADIMEAFGQRGGPVMINLMNAGSKAISQLEQELAGAAGTAKRMSDIRMDNLAGDWSKMHAAAFGLANMIMVALAPQLRSTVQWSTAVVKSFAGWVEGGRGAQAFARAITDAGIAIAAFIAFRVAASLASWVFWITSTNTALRAMQVQVVQTSAGIDAYSVSTATAGTRTAAFNTVLGVNIGTLGRFQAAALIAGAALVGWQIGRLIAELTGLDNVIGNVANSMAFGQRDWDAQKQSIEGSLRLIDAIQAKFGSDESISKQADAARQLLAQITAIEQRLQAGKGSNLLGDRADLDKLKSQLSALAPSIDSAQQKLASLTRQAAHAGRENAALWAEARRETMSLGEAIEYVALKTKQRADAYAKELAAAEAAHQVKLRLMKEEQEAIERAVTDANKRLLSVGFASESAVSQFETNWRRITTVMAAVPLEKLAKAYKDDLLAIGVAATNAGRDISAGLGQAVAIAQSIEAADKAGERFVSMGRNFEATVSRMEKAGQVGVDAAHSIAEGLAGDVMLLRQGAISWEQFTKQTTDEIKKLKGVSEETFKALPVDIQQAIIALRALDDKAKEMEGLEELKRRMGEVKSILGEFWAATPQGMEEVNAALATAAENGIATDLALLGMADRLEQIREVNASLGIELPATFDALLQRAQSLDALLTWQSKWREGWVQIKDSMISGFSQAATEAILTSQTFAGALKSLWKSLTASILQFLIEMAIRRLILGKIAAVSGVKEHGANVTAGLAETYVNSFASAAAIPFIGWAMAPGVAAANLATATGVAVPMMATAASGAAMASGGVVSRPTRALIGEQGPEAVVPLRGRQARRVAEEMGLGQFGQSGDLHVHLTLGDNWSEGGKVPGTLIEQIVAGVRDGIRRGTLMPLPTGNS